MFGQRTIIEKYHEKLNSSTNDVTRGVGAQAESSLHNEFLKRLFTQAKELSQIVAYIWRWIDEDVNNHPKEVNTAKSLHQYFVAPREIGENSLDGGLKKLLGANPQDWLNASEQERTNLSDKKEAELLVAVFGEDRIKNGVFPILNDFEKSEYLLKIDFNAFQGNIADPTKNTNELLSFTIPYPPSPKFGESTVTLKELDDWINNTNERDFIAKNPYIPTSSS